MELVAGVLLLVALYINNDGNFTNVNLGDILVISSAFMLALNASILGKYLRKLHVSTVTFISFITCSLMGLVVDVAQGSGFYIPNSFEEILMFLFIGAIATALAFVIQNFGIEIIGESDVSFVLGSESIWGIAFGALLFGNAITIKLLIAVALIFIGFILIRYGEKKGI